MTVAQILDWFEAHPERAYSPVALLERQRIWRMFRERMAGKELSEARPVDLRDFILEQPGVKSNHSRRRWKATICAPFNEAERLGLIQSNPFRGVRFAKGTRGRDWSNEEFRSILRFSTPCFRRLIVFLRYSGARPGEARTLQWDHVRDGLIELAEHKTAHVSDEPRRIYFNHVTLKLLTWLKKRSRLPWVFLNSRGRPWSIGALTKYLRDVRRRAGLSPGVRLHGGRHTFACAAIENGVDVATLAELLGHKDIKTTAIYLHLARKKAWLSGAAQRAIGNGKWRQSS